MSKPNQNGKGDSPRNCFSGNYKKNFDSIFRKTKNKKSKDKSPWSSKCSLCDGHYAHDECDNLGSDQTENELSKE